MVGSDLSRGRGQTGVSFFFFTSIEGSAATMSSSTGWVELEERTVGESNVES